jgi:hypothetical protein
MTDLLTDVTIASPCRADWNAMAGDARRRFCADCKLHVHDLSAMTAAEAEAFLRAATTGRTCVRIHRRADGRVLTRDCPVGLRQRLRAAWARAAALACALWSAAAACARPRPDPVEPATAVPAPAAPGVRMGEFVMGDLVPPSPAPTPPVTAPPGAAPGPRAPVK